MTAEDQAVKAVLNTLIEIAKQEGEIFRKEHGRDPEVEEEHQALFEEVKQ